MAEITALIDANVFYAMATTDIVLETAKSGLFRARWTDAIHDEWMENLLRNNPSLVRDRLVKRRAAMNNAIRDCLVTGYEPMIPTLSLPDRKDRHVFAAAIVGGCDAIVTFNLRHFPTRALAPLGIAAVHPDTFLVERFDANEGAFLGCVKKCRERLMNPPRIVDDHLARLAKVGLPVLASRLDQHKGLL